MGGSLGIYCNKNSNSQDKIDNEKNEGMNQCKRCHFTHCIAVEYTNSALAPQCYNQREEPPPLIT